MFEFHGICGNSDGVTINKHSLLKCHQKVRPLTTLVLAHFESNRFTKINEKNTQCVARRNKYLAN